MALDAADAIRWALLTGATIFIIGLLPLFKLQNKPPEPVQVKKTSFEPAEQEMEKVDSSFKRNIILIFHFSFASFLIGFGSGLVVPYLNLYFSNRFDASNAYIGLILSLGSAMTAVAMLIGPALVKKVGKVKALILFQMLSIPFLLLTAYTTSLLFASLGFLMRQALMNAGNPIQSAIAMEIVADKYKGLANSVNQMCLILDGQRWACSGGTCHGKWFVLGLCLCIHNYGGLYVVSSTYYYFIFGRRKLSEE